MYIALFLPVSECGQSVRQDVFECRDQKQQGTIKNRINDCKTIFTRFSGERTNLLPHQYENQSLINVTLCLLTNYSLTFYSLQSLSEDIG